jgi:hypothetical protein
MRQFRHPNPDDLAGEIRIRAAFDFGHLHSERAGNGLNYC